MSSIYIILVNNFPRNKGAHHRASCGPAVVIQWLTLNHNLDLELTLIKYAHRLIIIDICAEVFVDPNRGSKIKERTR